MSTIIAFIIGALLIGVAFKAGQNWERSKPPTPGQRQERRCLSHEEMRAKAWRQTDRLVDYARACSISFT